MTFRHHLERSYRVHPRWWVGGALAFAVAFILTGLVIAGYYPIGFVDGTPIWAHRFMQNYRFTNIYYQNLKKAAATQTSTLPIDLNLSRTDLETSVLNSMIAEVLVSRGARQEIGSGVDQMVAEKLAPYDSDTKLQMGARTLYGMEYADFRKEVLVPQAKTDLLTGRLYLRSIDFKDWLTGALQAAKIVILSSAFRWDGTKIVAQ